MIKLSLRFAFDLKKEIGVITQDLLIIHIFGYRFYYQQIRNRIPS